MSQKEQQFYVESVSGSTVQLEPGTNFPPSKAGVGIRSITVNTVESTAEAGFWGATGTCATFVVIVRKLD